MTNAWRASEKLMSAEVNNGRIVVWWIAFGVSVMGALFPHLYASAANGDAKVARWMAIAILAASSMMLISYYTRWF